MKKLIATSFMLVPIGIAAHYYHGFHKTYLPQEAKLQSQIFVYQKATKNNGMFPEFADKKDFFFSQCKEKSIPNFHGGSITYGDHRYNIEETQDRTFLGIFVDPKHKEIVNELVKAHPELKIQEVPELTTFKVEIPYRSWLTFPWFYMKIHPQLRDFLKAREEVMRRKQPIIDYFYLDGDKFVKLESHIPYGENVDRVMPSQLI